MTPKTIIIVAAFGNQTVNMWIPFKRASESVKHTNKTRNKVLRLIYLIKHVKDDALNSTKKAV